MIPAIETERLRLRGWSERDFEPFAAIYADEGQARYIGGACDREDAWRRMALVVGHWTLRGFGLWALEEKSSGAYCGWAGLWAPQGWPEPEVGWTLTLAARGRGLATEAALRARAYAYETLGWTTTISLIAMTNQTSIAVAERMGARMERSIVFREVETGIFRHPDKNGNLVFERQFH